MESIDQLLTRISDKANFEERREDGELFFDYYKNIGLELNDQEKHIVKILLKNYAKVIPSFQEAARVIYTLVIPALLTFGEGPIVMQDTQRIYRQKYADATKLS